MRLGQLARRHTFVVVALLLGATAQARAGTYGDQLGKCLVDGTTAAEKATLVRWMFSVMSLHPDVQSSAAVTPEQRSALAKETAELFQRLLTVTCVAQARDAVKYDMQSPIQTGFGLLGQAAVAELFTHPNVAEGLADISKHIDEKKLAEAIGAKK